MITLVAIRIGPSLVVRGSLSPIQLRSAAIHRAKKQRTTDYRQDNLFIHAAPVGGSHL
jgi:hypothetical protein